VRLLAAMALQVGAVVVLPLLALAVFEAYWYATEQWPFGFGSTAPDLIAAGMSLAGLFVVLAAASARAAWKLLAACIAPLLYFALRLISGLYVACANGNCL
jgi:hypothetical protein